MLQDLTVQILNIKDLPSSGFIDIRTRNIEFAAKMKPRMSEMFKMSGNYVILKNKTLKCYMFKNKK